MQWLRTVWMIHADLLTPVGPKYNSCHAAIVTASEAELYFQDESLLIGEEIDVREDLDEYDTDYDSGTDTDINSDCDILRVTSN